MPAIIFEEVALNHTSTASYGIVTSVADFSSNYPIFNASNDPEEFWPLFPTDDANYHEFAATRFGVPDYGDDNFGSPLPFDASENGLWNGRFVPPPPRPPFLEESIIADGITTCDLCSWARPTKTPFINEEALQKATEFWPFVVFAMLSLIIGASLTILICQRKRKKSADRNETTNAVQWWSRNKQRPHTQSVRRNNIYTGNPADSIRGLHPNILQNHRQTADHHNNNNRESEICHWSNVTSCVVSR